MSTTVNHYLVAQCIPTAVKRGFVHVYSVERFIKLSIQLQIDVGFTIKNPNELT